MVSKSKLERIFFWILIVITIIAGAYGVWKERLDVKYKKAVISASEEITNE